MKSLNGKELAGFIKERQAHEVATMPVKPKLLILRDSDNPVRGAYRDSTGLGALEEGLISS